MPRRTKQERQEVHRGQLMLDVLVNPIADMETANRWFKRIHDEINDKSKDKKAKANAG